MSRGNSTSVQFEKTERLSDHFFDQTCIDLAKNLLGCVLVRRLKDDVIVKGKIVETECYLGAEDKASHSYRGKKTPRNEPMFMKPGTIYVYQTYGMYYCMNISSRGEGAAVLLRSIEPLIGLERMADNRRNFRSRKSSPENRREIVYKPHELCNGPSKLCISFDINSENCNKKDIALFPDLWIEGRSDEIDETNLVASARIGIDSAGAEWASKLLRYYVYGNKNVSVRDKKREKLKESDPPPSA